MNPAAVGTGTTAGGAGTLTWALDRRPTTLDPLYARSAADLLAARQVDEPLVEALRGPFDETAGHAGAGALGPAVARRHGLAGAPASRRPLPGRGALQRLGGARQRPPLARRARRAAAARGTCWWTPRAPIWSASSSRPPTRTSTGCWPRRGSGSSPRGRSRRPPAAPLDPGRFPESGTGPFELRERSADRLLLARNTDWWGTERDLGPGHRPARAPRRSERRPSGWRCCATARHGWRCSSRTSSTPRAGIRC